VRNETLPARPKLVVAVDPRHVHAKPARLDDRLLEAAVAMRDQLKASIRVVHAYEVPLSSTTGTLVEPFRMPSAGYVVRDHVQKVTRDIQSLGERHEIAATQCELVSGEPVSALPAFTKKQKADVLVMGIVSRSAIARPIIGNTAEKVIDHVDCDVFVVKPARFKSQVPSKRPIG
jgi:universal stress protein E